VEADRVKRLNQEPSDDSAEFVMTKQGNGFVLRTAGGKFVSPSVEEGSLLLADTAKDGLEVQIEIVPASP